MAVELPGPRAVDARFAADIRVPGTLQENRGQSRLSGKLDSDPSFSPLPLIGVNTFLPREHAGETATTIELIRSTEEEKGRQIANVQAFQNAGNPLAPSGETDRTHEVDSADAPVRQLHDGHGLRYLQDTARERRNVFEALMEAVKTHSLGQISHALYDVGGEYRQNM